MQTSWEHCMGFTGSEQGLLRKRNPVKTLLLARDILSATLHVKF